MEKEEIVILSDLHLGCPRSKVHHPEQLRPLWRDATHLVINGDAAEIHHPQVRAEAARQILLLQSLCERDGVRVILVSGNHDAFISDTRHLLLAEKQVFVTHGDVLHPSIAPWSRAAHELKKLVQQSLEKLPKHERNSLHGRLSATQHASLSEWAKHTVEIQPRTTTCRDLLLRPWSVAKLLKYWLTVPRVAAQFATDHAPQSRFVVIGHSHRHGIWHVGERVVLNTGGFGFPARPRAVILKNGRLKVMAIRKVHHDFQYKSQPLITFDMQPCDIMPASMPPEVELHRTSLHKHVA